VTGVRRVRLWDLDFPNNPADFWQNMACPPIWNGLAPKNKKSRRGGGAPGVAPPRGVFLFGGGGVPGGGGGGVLGKYPGGFRHAGLLVNKPPGNTGLFFT
jgi:hypothetical protein